MLKVIDIDRRRNRLILSERLAMREWRRKMKDQLLDSLAEGDVYDGVISSIADFGAFVDLGGADGLIHLSELSWNRVNHPSEVVKVGQDVKVQILNVDQDRRRIGLSLRRLQPHPWDLVEDHYEVGQIVRGQITKLVNFGAFARLDKDGIEGLIHISELSEQRVGHPKEVVAEGEEHDLRVIRIDVERRRMGLSLKQALPQTEEPEVDWQIAPSDESADLAADEEDFSDEAPAMTAMQAAVAEAQASAEAVEEVDEVVA
jgi:small subunit ribosomal protein S1